MTDEQRRAMDREALDRLETIRFFKGLFSGCMLTIAMVLGIGMVCYALI